MRPGVWRDDVTAVPDWRCIQTARTKEGEREIRHSLSAQLRFSIVETSRVYPCEPEVPFTQSGGQADIAGLKDFVDSFGPEVMMSWLPCLLNYPPRLSKYPDII
ncbi:hypothetical protein AMECASPLE_019735 [Ameca splendens]|uniref:Uncharacterized protein n=1 Tax=Ameca splendens TaxID=208324 RepID=A0ABV0Z1J1_9TELE